MIRELELATITRFTEHMTNVIMTFQSSGPYLLNRFTRNAQYMHHMRLMTRKKLKFDLMVIGRKWGMIKLEQ